MSDLFQHLSTLAPDQLAAAAVQYGAGLVIALALLWKGGWGLGKGVAWLFRASPPSPLGAAILEALDAPDAITPSSNSVEAGGVRLQCVGLTWQDNPNLCYVRTGEVDSNVLSALTPHDCRRISRKARSTHRAVEARENAGRALAALARIPAKADPAKLGPAVYDWKCSPPKDVK